MASSKGSENLLVYGGGVFFLHLLFSFERSWLGSAPGQREDLKGAAVKGDEVLVNEPVPCQDKLIDRDSQKGADFVIAVERQAETIAYEHQEQVEGKFMVAEGVEKAIFEETMLDEAEGAGDLTNTVGPKDDFPYHGLQPPIGGKPKSKRERKSIESFFARNG
jgi:hypothetical protein